MDWACHDLNFVGLEFGLNHNNAVVTFGKNIEENVNVGGISSRFTRLKKVDEEGREPWNNESSNTFT